jgi:membrane associated rhomboid family serine protease
VFLAFYVATACVSSASHCLVSALFLGRADVAALGASGAACGLLLLFALLFPRQRILVFGIVPVPALWGALAFVAIDVWGLIAQGRGAGLPIGHGAHLGGSLCGALMYWWYLRPRLEALRSSATRQGGMPTVALTAEEAAEFERIRRKLAVDGPESLNPKERHFLRTVRDRALTAR